MPLARVAVKRVVFLRLRQNTLQLVEAQRRSRQIEAAGMISLRQGLLLDRDGEATAP